MSHQEFCTKPKKKMRSIWGNYILRCSNKYCSRNRCEPTAEIDKRKYRRYPNDFDGLLMTFLQVLMTGLTIFASHTLEMAFERWPVIIVEGLDMLEPFWELLWLETRYLRYSASVRGAWRVLSHSCVWLLLNRPQKTSNIHFWMWKLIYLWFSTQLLHASHNISSFSSHPEPSKNASFPLPHRPRCYFCTRARQTNHIRNPRNPRHIPLTSLYRRQKYPTSGYAHDLTPSPAILLQRPRTQNPPHNHDLCKILLQRTKGKLGAQSRELLQKRVSWG